MIDVSHQDVCSLSVRLPYLYQSMSFSYLTAYSGIGGKTIINIDGLLGGRSALDSVPCRSKLRLVRIRPVVREGALEHLNLLRHPLLRENITCVTRDAH